MDTIQVRKLLDFCYKSEQLNHVTERCTFNNPATITTASGNTVKVLWPLA